MSGSERTRWRQRLGRVVYWLAVLAVSLVLVGLLLAFFESRDASKIGSAPNQTVRTGGLSPPLLADVRASSASAFTNRAKTTMRRAAL